MKCIRGIFLIVLTVCSLWARADEYADPSYYLVDSLDLSDYSSQEVAIIDSLLAQYHNATEDTSKLKYILELTGSVSLQPRKLYLNWMVNYLEKAIDTSQNEADKEFFTAMLAKILVNQAITSIGNNDFKRGLEAVNQSIQRFKSLSKPDPYLSSAYMVRSYIFSGQGENQKLLENCREWEQALKEIPNDQDLARCYGAYGAYYYYTNDFDQALTYYQKNLKLSRLTNNPQGIAEAIGNIGLVFVAQGDFEGAIRNFNEGIQISRENGDSANVLTFMDDIGGLYLQQGKLKQALNQFYEALNLAESINNLPKKASMLTKIAKVQVTQKEFVKALKNYQDALAINQELGLKLNEGNVFYDMSSVCLKTKDTGQALQNVKECLRVRMDLDDSVGIGNAYILQGEILLGTSEETLQQALENANSGYLMCKQYQDSIGIAGGADLLANIYLKQGDLVRAEQYSEESYVIAQRRKMPDLLRKAALTRYKVMKQLNKPDKALEAYELFVVMNDSLDNKEVTTALITERTRYEFEKQQALEQQAHKNELALKDQEQAQQRYWLIGISVFVLVLLILIYFILNRLRFIRSQKNIIEKQAEALTSLDAAKTTFFNNVAHELRTPLTLMIGHMESMLGERFGGINEQQRRSVQVARENSNRLMDLVSELLDLAKLESGNLELKTKSILLKPFVDRIFFTFESLAYQFGIDLQFQFECAEGLVLEIDDRKFEKVLNNLIINAIKFTPRGGIVQFRVWKNNEGIRFSVRDSGRGIAPKDMEHIFDRYFQSSDPNAPTQGGTGIGLAIVKEFTKLHHGEVFVTSELQKGSEFVIQLPVSCISDKVLESTEEETSPLLLPEYPVLKGRKHTVLVVEDHREMQRFITDVFLEYARVLVANDGEEALKLLEQNTVDLVTIDVMMPNLDGFGFLKRMKQEYAYRSVPTIMLTARTAEEDKLEALTVGVNDYMTKPFSQAELLARAANLIANYHERQQVQQTGESPQLTETDREEDLMVDEQLLSDLRNIVLANISEPGFTVAELARESGFSEKQLTRTLKRISGLTPLKYIREIKLLHAMELLRSGKYATVSEVCFAVGFEKPGYFTEIFTARFGKNPSYYIS